MAQGGPWRSPGVRADSPSGVAWWRVEGVAWWLGVAGAGCLCALGARAAGQQVVEIPAPGAVREADRSALKPSGAARTVRLFDFEEEGFNPEEVPLGWLRAQHAPPGYVRPGFPRWNAGVLDTSHAHGGRASVRLPTRGGSTSLLLSAGALPVFADNDYVVTCAVSTAGLSGARAVVAARFLDAAGAPLAGTEVRSDPILSDRRWTEVALRVEGSTGAAASMQIELLLLQPSELAAAGRGRGAPAVGDDLDGAAWFDDIRVAQLARVELATTSPGNIAVFPARPEVHCLVRDLTGERLRARLVVTDIDGLVVAETVRPVVDGSRPIMWLPDLPAFGHYTVRLDVLAGDALVGGAETSCLWVPAARDGAASASSGVRRTEVGLIADPVEAEEVAVLPWLAAGAGASFVTLPAWAQGDAAGEVPYASVVRPAADPMLRAGVELAFGLTGVPPGLVRAGMFASDDGLRMLASAEGPWLAEVRDLIDVYGQRVVRWRVARPEGELPPASAAIEGPVAAVRSVLSLLVPGPQIELGWRGDWGPPPAGPDAVELLVPSSFGAEVLPEWLADVGRPPAGSHIVIDLPDESVFGARAVVTELCRRAVALRAGYDLGAVEEPPALRLALRSAWTWHAASPGRRARVDPAPAVGALRTLGERLGGRRITELFDAGPDIRCYMLADAGSSGVGGVGAGRGGGALVAWTDTPGEPGAVLRAPMGAGPVRVVDPFGNEREVPPEPGAGGERAIVLTEMPVFIEGVDLDLLRFIAAFHIEPRLIPAVAGQHDIEVVLRNPWPVVLTGRLQLSAAEEGGHNPAIWPPGPVGFSAEPGGTVRLGYTLTLGPGQESGVRQLDASVRLTAERSYGPLRLRAPLEIGLADLEMVATATAPQASGRTVVVARVTNRGGASRTLNLAALAPGRARLQVPISNLAPGDTIVKQFVFPAGERPLAGARIRLVLTDIDSAATLNKTVRVP